MALCSWPRFGEATREGDAVRYFYRGQVDTYLDLYEPAGRRSSTPVVLVHGGYWKRRYSSDYLAPLARSLAAAGYVTYNTEYRREPGNPGIYVDDVACAVDWVTARTCHPVPPVVVGHSVGAQLSVMACARGASASGLILLAPVCDLEFALSRRSGGDAVRHYLGSEPSRTWDPKVVELDLLEILIHSPVDLSAPIEQSRTRALSGRRELIEVPNSGHYGVVNPLDESFITIVAAIRRIDESVAIEENEVPE